MPGPLPNPNSRNTSDKRPKPVGDGIIPEPPDWLNKNAKKIYRMTAKEIVALGVAGKCDANILAVYSVELDRFQSISQLTERDGKIENQQNKLSSAVLSLSKELGISPSARAKLRLAQPEQADELDELLNEEEEESV